MKLIIFSDPHLFLTRAAHFTRDSSIRRELAARTVLERILEQQGTKICVGDFFHSFNNSETNIAKAIELSRKISAILAGNHDHSKRVEVMSSLDIVNIANPDVVKFGVTVERLDGKSVAHYVGHHLTQEAFETALTSLTPYPALLNLLFLHCNYAPGYETDDSTLVLSKERAEALLAAGFDRVFIGHEHAPRDLYDGRIIIVGNTYPTGFADLSDKRYLVYETNTDTVESVWHWKLDEHLYSGPAADAQTGKLFYDLEVGADPKRVVELFKEGAFGVRIAKAEKQAQAGNQLTKVEKLPDLIEARLRGEEPQLLDLWTELKEAV